MAVLGSSRLLLVLTLTAAVVFSHPAIAHAAIELQESKVKAGMLYNFIKSTTWPAAADMDGDQQLKVCLLGGDAFDGSLNPIAGRTAQQYTIQITVIHEIARLPTCDVVFFHKNQAPQLSAALNALEGKPVLTVSDMDNFVAHGGMVELSIKRDQRIHLYVGRAAVVEAGLSIQNRLMDLAENK